MVQEKSNKICPRSPGDSQHRFVNCAFDCPGPCDHCPTNTILPVCTLDDMVSNHDRCQCTSPALFNPRGSGNCNVDSRRDDEEFPWCYVDRRFGDPSENCPDAIRSVSRPGWYWSKFACIVPKPNFARSSQSY